MLIANHIAKIFLNNEALEQAHISTPDKMILIDNLIQPPCGIMIVMEISASQDFWEELKVGDKTRIKQITRRHLINGPKQKS